MDSPDLHRKNGTVYASVPRGGIPGSGMRGDQLVEVVKPLYGLNDSPQRWWSTVREEVIKLEAQASVFDSCLSTCTRR